MTETRTRYAEPEVSHDKGKKPTYAPDRQLAPRRRHPEEEPRVRIPRRNIEANIKRFLTIPLKDKRPNQEKRIYRRLSVALPNSFLLPGIPVQFYPQRL